MAKPAFLKRRALKIDQCKGRPLYLFCLTGDEILQIADISRRRLVQRRVPHSFGAAPADEQSDLASWTNGCRN